MSIINLGNKLIVRSGKIGETLKVFDDNETIIHTHGCTIRSNVSHVVIRGNSENLSSLLKDSTFNKENLHDKLLLLLSTSVPSEYGNFGIRHEDLTFNIKKLEPIYMKEGENINIIIKPFSFYIQFKFEYLK